MSGITAAGTALEDAVTYTTSSITDPSQQMETNGQVSIQQHDEHQQQHHLPKSLEPAWLLLADLEREAWLPQQLDSTGRLDGTEVAANEEQPVVETEDLPAETDDLSSSARSLLSTTSSADYTSGSTQQLDGQADNTSPVGSSMQATEVSDNQGQLASLQINSQGSGSNSVGAALTAAAVSLLLGESPLSVGGRRGRSLLMSDDDDDGDEEEPESQQDADQGIEHVPMPVINQHVQPRINNVDHQQTLGVQVTAATVQEAVVVPLPGKAKPQGGPSEQQGKGAGLQPYKAAPDYSARDSSQAAATRTGKPRAGLLLPGAPRYRVGSQVGQGHFGEVWRAIRRPLKSAGGGLGSRPGSVQSRVQPTGTGIQQNKKPDAASTAEALARRSPGAQPGQASRFAASLSKSIDKVLHPKGHKSLHWQWPWQQSKQLVHEAPPPRSKGSASPQHEVYLGAESQDSYQSSEYEGRTESAGDTAEVVVLKRIFAERGEAVRMSGLRELHFGRLLRWVMCLTSSSSSQTFCTTRIP
jgi:hypothetical protein